MTVRNHKFTPEVLLSAPRRSVATPNKDGTLSLFMVSTYAFQTHSKSVEIRILNLETHASRILSKDVMASEAVWLGDKNYVLFLRGEEKGNTSLYLLDANKLDDGPRLLSTFNGSLSNLKTTKISSDTYAIALTGPANPAGELHNPETSKKPLSSARVYTNLFVRHWDEYVSENKNAIWYTTLKKVHGAYQTPIAPLKNALNGSLVPLESPAPFCGAANYDICENGMVFVARDPKLDPSNHTKTDLYYVPFKTYEEERAPAPLIVPTGGFQGYSNTPVFSPDGKSIAFTRMKSNVYESDKPRIFLLPSIWDLTNIQEFYETEDGEGGWDLRPDCITWSLDGNELYVTAEENGRGKLFTLPSSPRLATNLPLSIVNDGTVIDVKPLSNTNLLVTSSSLIESSTYFILDPKAPSKPRIISSVSNGGEKFGLFKRQIEEIWFKGAEDYDVHAWVIKPSNFDKSKKYPLAYLIHGGPQGAWNDNWSTRWNPAIFAEQGYIVVTPNPTGSTGYGMKLQNGIKDNWGGRPYIDLIKGFEYIENSMPFVDTSRAVALGASYGGYMVNWIQGHEFGRKFKALVTHDGVLSTLNQIASDELFFPYHDFGGKLWENRQNYEKWDPARFLQHWATPHLVIHNELDYRLPISEGLATFNVLQSRGIESRFLSFPDENHWVLKPENSLVWHKEVLGWINKYSGVAEEQEAFRKGFSEIIVSR